MDVNVLVYGHRRDVAGHPGYRDWLDSVVNGEAAYGMSDLVLSSFVRVLTNPNAFNVPTTLEDAIDAAGRLRGRPNCVLVSPGPMHWEIFLRLCRETGAKGNLITDAYLAALAIEVGAEWITTDRDFSRFPGLRWRHPLS